MTHRSVFFFPEPLLATLLLVFAPPLLSRGLAQGPNAEQASGSGRPPAPEAGTLILGTVAGEPGTSIAVPIYFKPSGEASLRALRVELEFVSNSVKFTKAEKAPVAEGSDLDLAVQVEELPRNEKNVQRTRLMVAVSVVDSNAKKLLPGGVWGFLNFRISPEATPYNISMNPLSVSAQDTSQKPVPVAVEKGHIIVFAADLPMAGCFIFTH
ncbi:MAG: hypothetical protein HY649_01585 [Acidobacteria bacterium]|nr:hypothetical protein [Acidobacteriota bacterium]